ncbi:glycosyltransferase family 4 protein [Fontimonas sp. SYSU GA230001]|uniref:glycosyltransferase family 4 protein n=1 Tax=Fontimonas sp. SYSU GA230001 TaxID=3142450 RepID=UPI0032B35B72
MARISVVGALPPPYYGAAKNTKIIADLLSAAGAQVRLFDTAPKSSGAHVRTLMYHVSRVRLLLRNLLGIRSSSTLYIVADGGFGIWYTLLYVVAFKEHGRIYIHHRNYSHIEKVSLAMKLIVRQIAPTATHIFLDNEMADRFEALYGPVADRRVVSNAATNDVAVSVSRARASGALRVGFLSNLTNEKGFDVVVETFLRLSKEVPASIFLLGGKAVGPREERLLKHLQSELGDRLDYRGAVYGDNKSKFFSEVDVFLFPTRYVQEAQPNVLFEAMAAGCFIIAPPRACIPSMMAGVPCALVPDGRDYSARISQAVIAASQAATDMLVRGEISRAADCKRKVALAVLDELIREMSDDDRHAVLNCER